MHTAPFKSSHQPCEVGAAVLFYKRFIFQYQVSVFCSFLDLESCLLALLCRFSEFKSLAIAQVSLKLVANPPL